MINGDVVVVGVVVLEPDQGSKDLLFAYSEHLVVDVGAGRRNVHNVEVLGQSGQHTHKLVNLLRNTDGMSSHPATVPQPVDLGHRKNLTDGGYLSREQVLQTVWLHPWIHVVGGTKLLGIDALLVCSAYVAKALCIDSDVDV